jgi:hypothetical protein
MPTKPEPHIFKGNINVCLQCFLKKEDPCHVVSSELESRLSGTAALDQTPIQFAANQKSHKHTCCVCQSVRECVGLCEPKTFSELCESCKMFGGMAAVDDEGLSIPVKKHIPLVDPYSKEPVLPKCSGHECPTCGKLYYYSIDCRRSHDPKVQQAQCRDCASQSAVLVARPNEIDYLAKSTNGDVLTGSERSERLTAGFSTYYGLTHETDGTLKTNWQELAHIHFTDIQKKIEMLRASELGGRKCHVETMTEATEKLSVEQKREFEKAALRLRKPKEEKPGKTEKLEKTSPQEDQKKLYEKLLTSIRGNMKRTRPDLSDADILARAERQVKRIQEDDASV